MKLITRETDYAVRALCYMGRQNADVISVTDLVKSLKIPRPFLRKILQVLNQEGILASFKGLGGGFSLAKQTEEIFLFDLISIFQGDFELNECLFKKKVCPDRNSCPLRQRIKSIEAHAIEQLMPVTIASLIKEGEVK